MIGVTLVDIIDELEICVLVFRQARGFRKRRDDCVAGCLPRARTRPATGGVPGSRTPNACAGLKGSTSRTLYPADFIVLTISSAASARPTRRQCRPLLVGEKIAVRTNSRRRIARKLRGSTGKSGRFLYIQKAERPFLVDRANQQGRGAGLVRQG